MSFRLALALGVCVLPLPMALLADESPQAGRKIEQHGDASYYGGKDNGRRTASGEIFDENAATAASPMLPLGSKATVTNVENGRSITVRINDRGPAVEGRIIDLSRSVARKLGMERQGVAPVRVEEHAAAQPTARLRREVENEAAREERLRISQASVAGAERDRE
jgi:rare lipoprotein A